MNTDKTMNPVKETPIARLESALDSLRISEKLVASVADKLVGDRCQDAGCSLPKTNGSGIFGDIETIADTVSRLAGDIEYNANRISERL